ncbi:hypothetical protein AbraIFM66950_004231 [Aspergillus brasiliensis]|nr:hypothetical protein AbraIFM66950_004231 [Aspergillus brasiliensis]
MAPLSQPDDPAPSQLLHYLPEYQVVICTACRYAVQPHGIVRHLKEIHRILRSRRRKYSHYVAGLSLKEPNDVVPPSRADQFPVPYLPVEPGLQCQSAGCIYLCVSNKRMQSHWRTAHGRRGDCTIDWCTAPLQTFFRGNHLRYFTSGNAKFSHALTCPGFGPLTAELSESQIHVALDFMDSALLDHYLRHTYQTFTTNGDTESIWRLVVPGLAYQNVFLLHGLLACTSLHRAHMSSGDADQEKKFLLRAYHHQGIALPQFRYAIEHPTEDNCHAIMAFAYLLVVYSFAADQSGCSDSNLSTDSLFLVDQNSDESIAPDSILCNWLYFLRAGCSMLCEVWEQLKEGPVRALSEAWDFDLSDDPDLSYMDRLLSVIPNGLAAMHGTGDNSETSLVWSEAVTAIYRQAAIALSRSFAYVRTHDGLLTTWDILRIWPMEVSLEYMTLLHQRHPGALILLAYYCILLKQMEGHWYFEGRAAMLLRAIQGHLKPEWHYFIQEPLQTVLGVPGGGHDPGNILFS